MNHKNVSILNKFLNYLVFITNSFTPDTEPPPPSPPLFLLFEAEKKERYGHTHNRSFFELFFHKESRISFPADTVIASPVSKLLFGNELEL